MNYIVWALLIMLLPGARLLPAQDGSGAKARLEQATALKLRGDNEGAKNIYESLLPELRGTPSQELSEVLRNLSDIANSAGQYDKAVAFSRESAGVCRQLGDKGCEARSHSDAGLALSNAGDYVAGIAEFEEGLKLSNEIGDLETSVLVLNNLGNVYYYQARYSDAFRSYDAAEQLVDKSSSRDWSVQFRKITEFNLATLYQRLGNDQRAINIYREELASRQFLLTKEVAHVLANLGILYRRLGDPKQALSTYREAEKYYARDKDTDGELGVLKNVGIVLALDLGRLKDALNAFDQALDLAKKVRNQREIMQALLYRAETLFRMDRLPEARKEFDGALQYANQLGTREEQWKALYGIGKIELREGRPQAAEDKFRDAIHRIETLRSRLQLTRLKTDFLADKRDVYDGMIQLLLNRNDVPAVLEYMERSRARVFQDRFFDADVKNGAVTLASLQARLDSHTALIEFWTGPDRIAAVWITHDAAGVAQKRVSGDEMAKFAQAASVLADNLGAEWQKNFQQISAMLPGGIAPFAQQKYPHLLIVPDGFLSLVPFELLAPSAGVPLLEHHDITYMPSAVLLMRGAPSGRRFSFPWQPQLTAFGDPVTTGESPLFASRTADDSGPLPGSGAEIRGIAAMSAGRARLYLQASDRKLDFLGSLHNGAPLLHVSTHAVADMDNPERSRLLFSPEAPGQSSSFLFLKELYDLDLRRVDLATLSACDTERGRLVPGEGIQAFSRALLAAGSRSAVTTLWRVPDQPTADFMKQFYYFLLKKHMSKAEALRMAKLQFFHSNTELNQPRFWAAFVLNGEGSEPVPRFISWQLLAAAVLLLAAALFVVFHLRHRRSEQKNRAAKAVTVEA
jgi:CHAT domain-containing protein/Tfp pilus assembly protein PilF